MSFSLHAVKYPGLIMVVTVLAHLGFHSERTGEKTPLKGLKRFVPIVLRVTNLFVCLTWQTKPGVSAGATEIGAELRVLIKQNLYKWECMLLGGSTFKTNAQILRTMPHTRISGKLVR